MEKIITLVLYE